MAGEKTTPLETCTVEGEVSKGADEYHRLPERIARYTKAKKRTFAMSEFIAQQALVSVCSRRESLLKLSNALEHCSEYLLFKNYFTVGKIRLSKASFCKKHTLCPMCAIRRSAKVVRSYMQRYEIIKDSNPEFELVMVTLTVKNGDDLRERYEHLEKSFRKYVVRRRDYFKRNWGFNELCKLHGAVYSYEITNKGNGWHPHIHVLGLISKGETIFQSNLSDEWFSITGDSIIVDARSVYGDVSKGFIEVLKYAMKFSDLTLDQNLYAYELLKGKKMLGSFGAFRGVKVPDSYLDQDIDDLPFIELLYQFYQNGGFLLKNLKSA